MLGWPSVIISINEFLGHILIFPKAHCLIICAFDVAFIDD